jgi:hypothetical protein
MALQGNVNEVQTISGTVSVVPTGYMPGGSGGNADLNGILSDVQTILRNVMTIIRAQVEDADGTPQAYNIDVSSLAAECDTLIAGLTGSGGDVDPDEPDTEKTLTSISAVYSGGDVAVGTAVSKLTGIVVTAHYSDGTSEAVTGYTLSGTIAEGSNTIAVSYKGLTTTFFVTGIEEENPLYGVFWPPKGKVLDWNVPEWDDVDNFAYVDYNSEYVDAGLPGGAFVRLDKLQGTVYIRTLTKSQYGVMEQGVYSVYANIDGEISTGGFTKIPHTVYRQFGGKTPTIEANGTTYYFMLFKFEIPAGQTGYFVSIGNAMKEGYFVSTDLTGIDDAYKPYYTLFGYDPSDRITEPATEVV